MFIGHYGPGYFLKKAEPRAPILPLLIGPQFVDYLFMLFLPFGIERVNLVPGFTDVNPFDLVYMPISHSLVGTLFWSVLYGAAAVLLYRKQTKGFAMKFGVICGLSVLSHYFLDVLVHTPDMPLFTNDSLKLGLGLWKNRYVTIAAETVAFLPAFVLYARMSRPGPSFAGRYGLWIMGIVLMIMLAATAFVPAPATSYELSAQALFFYTVIAIAGTYIDKKRVPA